MNSISSSLSDRPLPPYMKTIPFKHQEDGIAFSENKNFFAFFLEQGLGKTKLLIDKASKLFLEGKIDAVLLIAPSSGVCDQWVSEQIPENSAVPCDILMFKKGGSTKFDHTFRVFMENNARAEGKLKWLVTNTEGFSRDTYVPYFRMFLQSNKSMLAVDEGHHLSNPEAKRTKNIRMGLSIATKLGHVTTKVTPMAPYRAILTGTFTPNNPFALYSQFEFLCPGFWGLPFSSFKSRYGLERTDSQRGILPNGRTQEKQFKRRLSLKEMNYVRAAAARNVPIDRISQMYMVSVSDVAFLLQHPDLHTPYKNLPELKAKIAPYAFIRAKKDCLDLPEKLYEKVYVEMNPEQKLMYKKMVRDLEAEYQGVEMTALNSLTLIVRLAQITSGFLPDSSGEDTDGTMQIGKSNPKIEVLLERMEEYGEYPAIVVGRFVAEVHLAEREIKARFPDLVVETMTGSVSQEERKDILDRFKAGEVDVLCGTQRVIGTGLNLQRSSVEYALSNSYSYVDRAQMEDRIHRPGQEHACTYVDFLAAGTVDERIYEVLLQKKDLLDYMRGKSFQEFVR